MRENFPIDEMDFLSFKDVKTIDFTKDRDIINILGYNNETDNLVRIDPQGIYENMLEDGARIVITKNTKDGKFTINHKYDATLLAKIDDALKNITKNVSPNCSSECTGSCIEFCSFNCSATCIYNCANTSTL